MHGEQNEMGRLKAALIREYEDNQVSLLFSYHQCSCMFLHSPEFQKSSLKVLLNWPESLKPA